MRKDLLSTVAWLLAFVVIAVASVDAGSFNKNTLANLVPQIAVSHPRATPVDTNPCTSGACW
ncbi:MAG TPA: hypothetical protein VMU39_03430 [Solirubrobacteraceae bacterium]|nr:hypothetical protein [Solirubrobacteraceae bacterium]